MECRVWSAKCGSKVWSGGVEWRVWSVECKVWSVKCGVSQSATLATQNDMSTSCDTSKKARLRDLSHRHGNFSLTRVAHLTHVECHKVPRLPRKTT